MAHAALTYTDEIAQSICDALEKGTSLLQACRAEGMPPESTVRGWVKADVNGFAAKYARAREIGYERLADELFEIADDGRNDWIEREAEGGRLERKPDHDHINRARLRVDTRKWFLSKVLPKRFGDKLEVENKGEQTVRLVDARSKVERE